MPQQTTTRKQVSYQATTTGQPQTNPLYPKLWPHLERTYQRHLARHWAHLIRKMRQIDQQAEEVDHD